MARVVIVGGGIAGLAVAHALRQGAGGEGVEILVLEKNDRPGGNLRTEVIEGYTCEWGPNGFLDSVPETLALVRAVGLEARVQVSDDAARKRFIFRNGSLHELPGSGGAFLRSRLLSVGGKLRIGWEPFASARPPEDETIHAFAARRIGREAADILIDSMVSGIFAGDARRLSLRACFPKMWQMETDHGGLFRAMFARRRLKKQGDSLGAPLGRLTSFRGGTEELIRGVARTLDGIVRTGVPVGSLSETGEPDNRAGGAGPGNRARGARFQLRTSLGEALAADAVVLACPSHESATIVESLDSGLSCALREIPSASIAVVCLGYEETRLPRPLDGFGFLVPRGEGPRILGVLWDSSVYPGRAPAGRVLLRAMIGGARDPEAVRMSDEALLAVVRDDLRTTMGLDLPPVFVRIFRHSKGIPQYTVGHLDRLAKIDARLAHHPGLYLCGNSYRGIAINNCAAEAPPLAGRVLAGLGHRG